MADDFDLEVEDEEEEEDDTQVDDFEGENVKNLPGNQKSKVAAMQVKSNSMVQ